LGRIAEKAVARAAERFTIRVRNVDGDVSEEVSRLNTNALVRTLLASDAPDPNTPTEQLLYVDGVLDRLSETDLSAGLEVCPECARVAAPLNDCRCSKRIGA
jgi:hypothetical protein